MDSLKESDMVSEDVIPEDNDIDERSENLRKLEQLSGLGLHFFIRNDTFDNNLDAEAVQLNLLQTETENSGSLQDPDRSDFDSLREIASDLISLSSDDEKIELINRFPESDSIPVDKTGDDKLPIRTPVNDVCTDHVYVNDNDEVSKAHLERIQKNFEFNDTINKNKFVDTLPRKLILNENKKVWIQRLKNVRKPKLRVIYDDGNFSNNNKEKMVEDRFVGGAENNYHDILLKSYEESADLENKLNVSFLNMLKENMGKSPTNSENNLWNENSKIGEERVKFITIHPSKPDSKFIGLMINGRTCRSKTPLNDTELSIVTKILCQENVLEKPDDFYKNVYYDVDSNTNIRYEVKRGTPPEEHNNPNNYNAATKSKSGEWKREYDNKNDSGNSSNKKDSGNKKDIGSKKDNDNKKDSGNKKHNDNKKKIVSKKCSGNKKDIVNKEEIVDKKDSGNKKENNKEKYFLKSIARTRSGRISRPPRHVIRDYERWKHISTPNGDIVDKNKNTGGYAAVYRMIDYGNTPKQTKKKSMKKTGNVLYDPVEPDKRQFSSLSLCPTCGKVYLGYESMAVHFQKYPEHKDEELLDRILHMRKKSCDDSSFKGADVNSNEEVASPKSNKGAFKKKRKMQSSKNENDLKKLLSNYGTEEIINCLGPVIARVLDSWQYLILRSKQLKKNDETLVTTLLKEISTILKQIRSLSHCILRPYKKNKKNVHRFVIEDEDILQHVLGVTPGTYLISDDNNWFKESPAVLNNTNVGNIETKNKTSVPTKRKKKNRCLVRSSPIKPYEICIPDEVFPVDDLILKVENDPLNIDWDDSFTSFANSNGVFHSTCTTDTGQKRHDETPAVFRNLNEPSKQQSSGKIMQLENVTSYSVNDYSELEYDSEFDDKTFCSKQLLSIGSFMHNNNLSNDFPGSVTFSDPSDSKDCLKLLRMSSAGNILNNLKNMDNSAESSMVEFQNVGNVPTSSDHTEHLS